MSPLEELDRCILPALERPPCLVSFSGGRDFSAVFAVAARLARRAGLPLPIPATIRFRTADRSAEDDWQARVVAHAELADWVRIEVDDELDCLGPVATPANTVGSIFEITQSHIRKNSNGQSCIFDKRLGEPDFHSLIPIANCSESPLSLSADSTARRSRSRAAPSPRVP
jgi:hypothetical protein